MMRAGLVFDFDCVTYVLVMNTRRARPGNALLTVAYLRASTEDQKLGPEAQRAAIEAWAAQAGITVAAWHVDSGVSGGSALDARPALGAALAALRGMGAGVLVVAKRDRLARDVAVAAMIEKATLAAGARVVSADGAGNGDSPADAFMRTLLDGAAAYESELIRARTKAALAAKRARVTADDRRTRSVRVSPKHAPGRPRRRSRSECARGITSTSARVPPSVALPSPRPLSSSAPPGRAVSYSASTAR